MKRQFIVGTAIALAGLAAIAVYYSLFVFLPETPLRFKILVNAVAFLSVLGGCVWGFLNARRQRK